MKRQKISLLLYYHLMMNLDVVIINDYSLLSPNFKISISKFYNF